MVAAFFIIQNVSSLQDNGQVISSGASGNVSIGNYISCEKNYTEADLVYYYIASYVARPVGSTIEINPGPIYMSAS